MCVYATQIIYYMCTFNYKYLEAPISGGWPLLAAFLVTIKQVYVCAYVYIHAYMCTDVCPVYVCMCVCVYIYTLLAAFLVTMKQVHACANVYVHMFTVLGLCVCVHTFLYYILCIQRDMCIYT